MSQAYPYYSSTMLNQSRYLTCVIQDGKIFTWNTEGTQQIGVTNQAYNDLKEQYDSIFETSQKYYDRLVLVGEITPELSPEDIIKQQAEQLRQSNQTLTRTQEALDKSIALIESLTSGGTPHEPVETDQRGINPGDGPVKNKKPANEGRRTEHGA